MYNCTQNLPSAGSVHAGPLQREGPGRACSADLCVILRARGVQSLSSWRRRRLENFGVGLLTQGL